VNWPLMYWTARNLRFLTSPPVFSSITVVLNETIISRANIMSIRLFVNTNRGDLKRGGSNATSKGIWKQLNVARIMTMRSHLILRGELTLRIKGSFRLTILNICYWIFEIPVLSLRWFSVFAKLFFLITYRGEFKGLESLQDSDSEYSWSSLLSSGSLSSSSLKFAFWLAGILFGVGSKVGSKFEDLTYRLLFAFFACCSRLNADAPFIYEANY
jgi:hypothetical protein